MTQVRAMALAVNRRPLIAEVGFNPRPIHVGFVAHKVALGQDSLQVFRLSPVNGIPLMLHT